ncbi:MAG: DNA polymerase II large subunit [Candidatus Nanoarchaeia archaeon]|nr:DNA polymerase II large subunit [Candidatus Nanoarchaeia archaeon]MDD5358063.1 DNA polymerase II large subunit [Candidatus Nanoarchaeia archaeon]MDD5589251.1 DNA polymerase II large subunit [Candidatus Nanoarchaeia archaeon]
MNTQEYFIWLDKEVKKVYDVANEARAKNLDPVNKVEIPLARSLAEKVVGLISTIYPQMEGSGIAPRILELEKEFGKLTMSVSFRIAEEVAKQKYCKFANLLEAIDAGIRIGFSYTTLGVVSSPIEGFTGLKLGKTRDNKEYFIASFSGPIRSAGTTASCVVLMLIDYLRELFGYAKYDPSEDEVKRYVTENYDYHEYVTNLQYLPTVEEATFLAKNLPIQIAGDPTEKLEVSNFKNLDRVDTNFIRGGMCLIFSEGLSQKAKKGLRLLKEVKSKGFQSTGFDFLDEYVKIHEKRDVGKTDDSPTYIQDLVAGRPVFGHPARSGAFRFRYGRGRVSGFSATSMHPATMGISDSFIAIGTQLKIEKPTKGCVVTTCDVIDGPIVKLFSGSVRKVKSKDEAKKLYPDVEEIIYMGDVLFPFSDVANRNSVLIRPGYVEEWWKLELRQKNSEMEKGIDCFNVPFEEAAKISKNFGIPLHPSYIFYWSQISKEEFIGLVKWIKNSRVAEKIILPYNKTEQEKFKLGKRALELLGVEHEVTIENVVINETNSKALLSNLGIDFEILKQETNLSNFVDEEKFNPDKTVLEIVNSVSKFVIKDKAGEFIGTRMGRPEKAKLRKLIGSPNILFPVGKEGGRLRSLQAACEGGNVKNSFPIFYCEECKKNTIYSVCENCGKECKKLFYCKDCDQLSLNVCREHNIVQNYHFFDLDVKHYFDKAVEKLGLLKQDVPVLIKGVRGTSSQNHDLENICKGILRAKYNLQVNKDGTIRFDATELPIVSFKPKEVFVSIDKLKEIGYDRDIYGKELTDENQILELMPHDVILPCSPETADEKADDVFISVCNFVDALLEKFYGLKSIYNIKKREDLVGQIGVCMAPHNCAGVICRFIGFSNTLGLLASPYMHAAIRRDCDGDEAALMLLGDVLLNFSRKFLPGHRGGTQDAPLVLNAKIDAGEVDDQILDFELTNEYPLELYQFAEQKKHSSEMKLIPTVKTFLKEGKNPFVGIGFTHDTSNFNDGVICSSYKSLETMQDKVDHQMALVEKIRAVDTSDTAKLIIDRHFIKDLKGNLRKFSMQGFRCVACNEIMRRPPLTGVCQKCGGKIIFTINEGGIKKYLEPALNLANKYNLSNYIKQNLEIIKENIDSVFGKELEKQEDLAKWF